jgi:hypothetical protein
MDAKTLWVNHIRDRYKEINHEMKNLREEIDRLEIDFSYLKYGPYPKHAPKRLTQKLNKLICMRDCIMMVATMFIPNSFAVLHGLESSIDTWNELETRGR